MRSLEAQLSISAVDRTGKIFDTVGKKIDRALAPAAAAIAAYKASHVTKKIVEKSGEAVAKGQHERVRMETSGMTPEEIRQAEEHAARLTAEFKPVSQTTILHLLRNARSIVGTYEEAAHILDPLLKLYVVAQGSHPEKVEQLAEDFDKLVKGLEIKGVTQDMPKFTEYL